jgi:hypothetical protein
VIEFEADLFAGGHNFVCIRLTPEQSAHFPRRQTRVLATVDGRAPYSTVLQPMGDGTHLMVVNKQMRGEKRPGDSVWVKLEATTEKPKLTLPEELEKAFSVEPAAQEAFDRLATSHQREHLQYVAEAKKPETRLRRALATVDRLLGRPSA